MIEKEIEATNNSDNLVFKTTLYTAPILQKLYMFTSTYVKGDANATRANKTWPYLNSKNEIRKHVERAIRLEQTPMMPKPPVKYDSLNFETINENFAHTILYSDSLWSTILNSNSL